MSMRRSPVVPSIALDFANIDHFETKERVKNNAILDREAWMCCGRRCREVVEGNEVDANALKS